MNHTKRQRIQWLPEEYEIIFSSLDTYVKLNKDFPSCSNKSAFSLIQKSLPVDRQKELNSFSTFYALKSKYFEYLSKKNKSLVKNFDAINEEKTKLQDRVKNVLTKPEPNDYHTKLGEVGLEFFFDALDSKFVTLYKSVSELIHESNRALPNHIVEAIMSQQTKAEDIVKPVTPDVEIKHEVKDTPVTPKDLSRMFTENEIRAIIREEIESLFGPIKTEPKHSKPPETKSKSIVHLDGNIFNNSKENLAIIPTKENITVLVGDDYKVIPVEKTSKYVYVCGLNSSQLQNLKRYFNHEKQIIIDGSENYNHDVKTKAKHADLVLVSKFSSHSTYETLKSSCVESEFDFVSGGMTMIKNRIRRFLNESGK